MKYSKPNFFEINFLKPFLEVFIMCCFVTKPSYINYETMNAIYAHGFRGVYEFKRYKVYGEA